jgi:probable rRNA maturation factor
MNRVDLSASDTPLPAWSEEIHAYVLKVLDHLARDKWDLSVLFCSDAYIRELNARFRDQDEPTDVLSFALGETVEEDGEERYLPGDIVISLETLRENARYFGVPQEEELRRLLIHGILHLDGMDHAGNAGEEPMLQLQENILTALSGETP